MHFSLNFNVAVHFAGSPEYKHPGTMAIKMVPQKASVIIYLHIQVFFVLSSLLRVRGTSHQLVCKLVSQVWIYRQWNGTTIFWGSATGTDCERGWTRFTLVAAAKEWDNAKRQTVVPTLLHGKLV